MALAEAGVATHPAVVPIQPLLARPGFDPALLRKLIQANRRDQEVHRYRTFDELLAYCDLSANPLGRLVLALFGVPSAATAPPSVDQDETTTRSHRAGTMAAADLLAASDAVCSALQVVEHLQDVREDYLVGRIYLPLEDLERFGCTEADLASAKAPMALRAVVCLEARRSREMLEQGAALVSSLSGWERLAVAGFVAGGAAALDAIEAAGHDVLARDCRPRPTRVARHMARLLLRANRP